MQQSLTNVIKSKATCVFNILLSKQKKMIIHSKKMFDFFTDFLAIM